MDPNIEKTFNSLKKNNFNVEYVEKAEDVAGIVLELIPEDASLEMADRSSSRTTERSSRLFLKITPRTIREADIRISNIENMIRSTNEFSFPPSSTGTSSSPVMTSTVFLKRSIGSDVTVWFPE